LAPGEYRSSHSRISKACFIELPLEQDESGDRDRQEPASTLPVARKIPDGRLHPKGSFLLILSLGAFEPESVYEAPSSRLFSIPGPERQEDHDARANGTCQQDPSLKWRGKDDAVGLAVQDESGPVIGVGEDLGADHLQFGSPEGVHRIFRGLQVAIEPLHELVSGLVVDGPEAHEDG